MAELTLVVLLVGSEPFGVHSLVLLLLLASHSLWSRRPGWLDAGLRRPASLPRTLMLALGAALLVLIAIRVAVAPAAVWVAGAQIDLSALGEPGDSGAFLMRLGQAWTLAALWRTADRRTQTAD